MSRYVIELRPDCKLVQQICESNGQVCIGARSIQYLEELNSDYINEHFGDLQDTAYQRGLEDGKAQSERGCEGCKYAGKVVTGPPCISCCNSYKNQWTAKQADDEIKVGDEVVWADSKCAVVFINRDIETSKIKDYDLLADDGSVAENISPDRFRKTGKHYDIDKILEEMRHD